MDLFIFNNYRDLINHWIEIKGERGSKSLLAKAAGCSPSWFTRVLSGEVQITPDQAFGVSQLLHFNEIEVDYFLNLVELERSATPELKKRIQKKNDFLKKQSRLLKTSIKTDSAVTEDNAIKYYSTWVYAAIHVACMIKAQSPEDLVGILNLKLSFIKKILNELYVMGLIKPEMNLYVSTSKNVHLPSEHEYEKNSHMIWRNRCIQFFQEGHDEGLHYSGIHCLAKKDIEKIHLLLKEAILKTRDLIAESPSENLAVFCLDWYAI